jgi:chorismate mutase/prephenate dehydratase
VSDPAVDPVVRDLRGEISELDRTILDAVNARLELVARLKRYKESQGLPFLDPERERQLVEELARANRGPLSDEGLRDLVAKLLELTKREVAPRDGDASDR